MSNTSLSNILIEEVNDAYAQMAHRDNLWENSPWRHINDLENDTVGKLGEKFISRICNEAQIDNHIDGLTTKELGGGVGDGTINGYSVEIKTARLGSSSPSFQHELGEKPWKSDYMLFLDITPEEFFISIFPNWTEEEYKTSQKKWAPYFPTKSCTWRKGTGAFKFDTTYKINITQSKTTYPNTFRWTPDTNILAITDFILSIIPPPQ